MYSKKNKEKLIVLKLISKNDHKFLYELLQERELDTNIIQKKMPTYEKHIKFVKSKPYRKWYIILEGIKKVGTIYLAKNNDIGIFITKKNQKRNVGSIALNMFLEKNLKKKYHAKINPKNKKSIKFFQKNKFKPIEYVLEFKP